MPGPATSDASHDPAGAPYAIVLTRMLGSWAEQARCAGTDPEIFFPPRKDPGTEARKMCAACPVRSPCLEYALEADERSGIWGGQDEDQRRILRRRRSRQRSRKGTTA
jgi:WhiB family redox-sensing transcriptional regulator